MPELVVENPLAERVLLYDGEELVGAKQNRIVNVSVLVEAKSSLRIPVSCVEQGRGAGRASPPPSGAAVTSRMRSSGAARPRRKRRTRSPGASRRARCGTQPGQCGALLGIGHDLCLDLVSRTDAFSRLWPKLRAGYLLDGLEWLGGKPTPAPELEAFLDAIHGSPPDAPALGRAG